MKCPFHFIIIDDDPVNNMLSSIFINEVVSNADIQSFELPENGLKHIRQKYSISEEIPTILLLDINMPTMSGWEFLEKFEELAEGIKNQFRICIMSSSVDPGDQQRAGENNNAMDYIEKPLSEEKVVSLCSEQFGCTSGVDSSFR